MFKMVRWFWCLEVLELGLFVPPGLLSSLFYLVSVLVVGQVVASTLSLLFLVFVDLPHLLKSKIQF